MAFKTPSLNVSGSWYLFLPSPLYTSSPSSIKFCLPKSLAGAIHISVALLSPDLEETRNSSRLAHCLHRPPQMKGLHNRNVFPHSSGGQNPRSRFHQCWFLVRPIFLPCRQSPSCHFLRKRKISGVSFSSYKDTNPIGLGPTLMTAF